MPVTRRSALRLAVAGAAAAAASTVTPASASAATLIAPPDAVGLLYDNTKCIGCKACVAACREANGLEPDTSWGDGKYHAPLDLSARAKTIIKLYDDGVHSAFVKAQCMHCLDPACASACMLGAFKKREYGIVSYDVNYCVGCRYCEVACPYGVPKFEWSKAAPKMVKCELCRHRLVEGKPPACTEVCPRKAVIFGKRDDLLREAHRRLTASPGMYVQKVYGEHDGGGTQCLYLSHVPFENLGLPTLGTESTPTLQRTIQEGIYKGFAAPVALYGLLGFAMFRNRVKDGERR